MVKPFSLRKLIAHVKAVLRRTEPPAEGGTIQIGGLYVDRDGVVVKVDGSPVDLTYAEFKLLSLLISNPGRVFTRQQIIEWLWEGEKVVSYKTVDVHVAHLRKKLGRYGDLIKAVRGIGYKLEA